MVVSDEVEGRSLVRPVGGFIGDGSKPNTIPVFWGWNVMNMHLPYNSSTDVEHPPFVDHFDCWAFSFSMLVCCRAIQNLGLRPGQLWSWRRKEIPWRLVIETCAASLVPPPFLAASIPPSLVSFLHFCCSEVRCKKFQEAIQCYEAFLPWDSPHDGDLGDWWFQIQM